MSVKSALKDHLVEAGYIAMTPIVTIQETLRHGDFKPEYWQEGFVSTVLVAASAYFVGGFCFVFGLIVPPLDPQESRMDRAVFVGKIGMFAGAGFAAGHVLNVMPPLLLQEQPPPEKQRQELHNHVTSPTLVFTDTKHEAEENLQQILATHSNTVAFQQKLIVG